MPSGPAQGASRHAQTHQDASKREEASTIAISSSATTSAESSTAAARVQDNEGSCAALLRICLKAWRLLAWVTETDEERDLAVAMLRHQRLALALLCSARSRPPLEPQPDLADRLWPRGDARRLLDSGIDKMGLLGRDDSAGEAPARGTDGAPVDDLGDSGDPHEDPSPARGTAPRSGGSENSANGRWQGPGGARQGGYPGAWIELLEQMRFKVAMRVKRHAFGVWAGKRRISRIMEKMHQRALSRTSDDDAIEQPEVVPAAAAAREVDSRASEMVRREQRSKGARALRAWRAHASGMAAARRWQRIADDSKSRFADQARPSPAAAPEATDASRSPPPVAWDDGRLRALMGIFSGMCEADADNLLDGLEPGERQVVEYQLSLLRRNSEEPGGRPSNLDPPAKPVSFCRKFAG